ncbi:MAG: hypothetical protein ACTSUR_02915 [Candidatus Heimdallarchaeaceae archaeon]
MYAVVDFTKTAKEYCTFDIWNLKIFIFDDDGNLIEERPFNDAEINELIEQKIPIVYYLDTSSCKIPDEYLLLATLRVK